MSVRLMGGGLGQKAISVDQFFDYLAEQGTDSGDSRAHYREVAWIYRAVNLRSSSLAAIPFTLWQGDAEYEAWPDDINLLRLLRTTEADLCLRGAAYWLKVISPVFLQDLQRLNPWTIRVEADKSGIKYFEQQIKGDKQQWKPEEIVYFDHLYNPQDDLGPGISPAQVAGMPASLTQNMNTWASNYFEHGAIPAVILTTDAPTVPDNERARIRRTWNRMLEGVKKAWRTVVLSHGLKAQVLGSPVKDLAMPELDTRTKEQIAAAYGIPMGILEQGPMNRATAEVHQVSFYTETLIPEAEQLQAIINEQLMDELGLRLEFHPEQIEAIQQREVEKGSSIAQVLTQVNQSALNMLLAPHEARAIIDLSLQTMGFPSLDSIEPVEMQPPEPEAEVEPPEDESKKGLAPTGGPPADLWLELVRWRSKAQRLKTATSFTSDIIPEWLAVQIKAAQELVGPEDAFLFLKQQSRTTVENRIRRKLRAVMREYEVATATAIEEGAPIDYRALLRDFRRVLGPEIEVISAEQVLRLAAEVGVSFDPAVINTEAAEWARRHAGELASGLTDTTRDLIREATATWVETPGMEKRDLISLLKPAFGDVRAEMIAVTEVTAAYSQAARHYQERLAGEGLEMVRVWHTAADDRVCPICGPLDGAPESVWTSDIPDGPPAHPRCRCSLGLSARAQNDLMRDHRRLQRERARDLADWPGPETSS